ncbi:hypothetical protein NDU88_005355 [Pleurodeles waltl]|uniref:Uncharacterized protein n=1 Tax=Pleurodeles waltl TaxID=8319 RepID=A0AAV7L2H4_PLEWA|nr:hypothetical protein NDU88_005355 [Pleurodeles waltl]
MCGEGWGRSLQRRLHPFARCHGNPGERCAARPGHPRLLYVVRSKRRVEVAALSRSGKGQAGCTGSSGALTYPPYLLRPPARAGEMSPARVPRARGRGAR